MKLKFTFCCYICTFLILISGRLGAQDRSIDSLKQLLTKTSNDSVTVELLNKLSFMFVTTDAAQAYPYGKQAIEIAEKSNFKRGLCQAYNNMGIIYDQKGQTDSALFYYNISLKLSQKIGNFNRQAAALSNIGYVYWSQGNYDKALDYTLKALAIYDTGSNYMSKAICIEHIAMIYHDLKDYPNSIKFHRLAIPIYQQANDELDIGNAYCNLALNYLESSKDSMVFYLKKAEVIFLKYEDHWALGHVYNNIGGVYIEMRKPDPALLYLAKARKEHASVSDERGMCSTQMSLGMAWLIKNKALIAKNYVDTAISMSIKMDMKESLAEAYHDYALVYAHLGVFDSVTKYLGKETWLRDSLFSGEKTKAIADMQTKYDTEKKDLEIAKHKAELEIKDKEAAIKNIIIFSIIGLVCLLCIVAYLFYNKKRIEQQAKLDLEISHQKEIRTKSIIETEEKERIRIAKDLHDGIGQLLSAAKLNLSSLENKMILKDPADESAFKNALDLLDESVKEVRTVSHNMMPNTLLKMGLASAVKEFITKIQNSPNLKVNLEIVGLNERLEQEKESVLYRVIQEVVSNIIKHAHATVLTLQLIKHDQELSITIEDNGKGFDTSKINDFEGIGLKNIISRVEFLNGTVHFDSTLGRGTNVIIEIPI